MAFLNVTEKTLATPIIEYHSNNLDITTIGTIHFGTINYYQILQAEIDRHPAGLYEGVRSSIDIVVPEEKRPYLGVMQSVNVSQRQLAKYVGMEHQKDNITYGENWVNADMTIEEIVDQMSIPSLQSFDKLNKVIASGEPYYRKDPAAFRRLLLGTSLTVLGALRGSGFIPDDITPNNSFSEILFNYSHRSSIGADAVIMDERNKRLFTHLSPFFETTGDLAIVYGVGHMPAIDDYLRQNGFEKGRQRWVTAWELDEQMSLFEALKRVLF